MNRNNRFRGLLTAILPIVVVILCGAIVRTILQSGFDHDEIEHAHLTWLLKEGIVPYTEIPQNHMPVLWIIFAGLFDLTGDSPDFIIVARFICFTAYCVSIALGWLILREVVKAPVAGLQFWLFLLLALSLIIPFEIYRYRPDPFMALFATLSVLLIIKENRAPFVFMMASGTALALSASFSTKIAPVGMLVPLLIAWTMFRGESHALLRRLSVFGTGFIVGLIPLLGWLWSNDLLNPWFAETVTKNAGLLGISWRLFLSWLYPVILLALLGSFFLLRDFKSFSSAHENSVFILILSGVLGLSVQVITVTGGLYNLQAFAIPGACLATIALVRIADIHGYGVNPTAAIAVVLIATLASPLKTAVTLSTGGDKIAHQDLRRLVELAKERDGTCLGFAPYHPVFCHDAAKLHLLWDIRFATYKWVKPWRREMARRLWSDAIQQILLRKPNLIVLPRLFVRIEKQNVISKEQSQQFRQMIDSSYVPVMTGDQIRVYSRKNE